MVFLHNFINDNEVSDFVDDNKHEDDDNNDGDDSENETQ